MAAENNKTSIDESDSHNHDDCGTAPGSVSKLAPFPCEIFQHNGDSTIHVAVVYKTSYSTCFTDSTTVPRFSTPTCPVGGASTSSSDSNELFYIYATLNGLDTIAQSTQRIVENHCPWLLDELSEEQDVIVRYGDANRAQRRQQNIDQQPIINVYLSHHNSNIKNIISPAAITNNVLKCGMIVTFLYDYRLLMRPLPLAAAAATRDGIESEVFVSESYGTTNTNMNVTSLRSRDSLTQQQQIILPATQKSKKKSRKSPHEHMAFDDLEVLNKKPKRNSKPTLQLPAASAAQELTAQSSTPTDTFNLPSELQTTPESAISSEQRKNAVDEPIVKHSTVTSQNNEVPGSTLVAQPTPPDALNIAKKSSRRRAKTILQPQQQQPAIDPLKAAPIGAAHAYEKSSVTASAVGSTAGCSREDRSRKSSSQRKITSSSQHPATASTSQDLVVPTTKLPTELGTSSENALEAKKQKSAENKSSKKKKEPINIPDDKKRNAYSSSTRVKNQPFHATSKGIHVPVPTPTEAAPAAASNSSEKYGTSTSVVDSIIDVHNEGAVRSSNHKNQRNKSSTRASSEKSEFLSESHGSMNTETKAPSLHSRDSLRPQKHTSPTATQKSKKKSRKSSSEHEAPNEAEVPKKKPKTSAGSSPVVHQSAAASKFSVITEKRKKNVDEPPKKEKKATKKSSDVNTPINTTEFINQAITTTVTQPPPLVTSINADIPYGNRKDKDVPYPQQKQPKSDSLTAAPIAPIRGPANLVAAPTISDLSVTSGKELETCTPKDKAVFIIQASSTAIAQPSPLVTVMNANLLDSHQNDKTFSFLQKTQPTSGPLKTAPIVSSITAALSNIDSHASTNKEGETFSPKNTACMNNGTSGEGISMDSLTMLTKIQLKDLCKIIKVPHSGSKKNLVDRLMKNRNSSEGCESTTSILETSLVRTIVNTVDKKQHSERVATKTEADAFKDASLISSGPTVNNLNVCSTTPQEASLEQLMADKKKDSTKDINEEQLASQHTSPITTSSDMLLSSGQIDREDRPLKNTNTDSSNSIISSGDCNTMDYLATLTSAQLKKICNTIKIPHTGTKKALIDRLVKNGHLFQGHSSKELMDPNAHKKNAGPGNITASIMEASPMGTSENAVEKQPSSVPDVVSNVEPLPAFP